ncbi:MAG: DMT family transporter [Nitrospirae bacterium]|nr:DMT family transporter [Nitrospirota bacterium]
MLTLAAMVAFAANSVLCRLALTETDIGPAAFTATRLATGAIVLWIVLALRGRPRGAAGSRAGAIFLFCYAAAFSFAYVDLPTGTGALLLFGAVQLTMIVWGIRSGERLNRVQAGGLLAASGGLVWLLMPGISAPPVGTAMTMFGAGVAWGAYSLLGRGTGDPLAATGGNFLLALAPALALVVTAWPHPRWDGLGMVYAALSGGVASGLGYAVWYAALRGLSATRAATVQLSVPLIAAVGGVLFLSEPFTARLAVASVLILGGIALVAVTRGGVGKP